MLYGNKLNKKGKVSFRFEKHKSLCSHAHNRLSFNIKVLAFLVLSNCLN